MSVIFLEEKWSWSMTLKKYLNEGNYPKKCKKWQKFFEENIEILYKISDEVEKNVEEKRKIYPEINHVFRAFIPVENISVVILGQDPYHNGSAVGLCFSVGNGNSINPSLKNIYEELENEGYTPKRDGNLTHWAQQGCFMLNTSLTVPAASPEEHLHIWYDFIIKVIHLIAEKNVVWLLMGAKSYNFLEEIIRKGPRSEIFCTSHPSPFSARKKYRNIPAFIGSGVFRKINDFLKEQGKKRIKW